MNYFETTSCIIAALSIAVSGVAATFTYLNLKEIRNQFFEQNRGNVIFYVDSGTTENTSSFILRNFGNAPVEVLDFELDPPLDWSKADLNVSKYDRVITDLKNVFIPPQKFVMSQFYFRKYPDKVFRVKIKYKTNGKTIVSEYVLDFNYQHYLLGASPHIKSDVDALKAISYNVQRLADRLL